MSAHTPGPWRAALYLGGAYYVTDSPLHEPCGREIAIVSGTWGNPGGFVAAGDNARLIAAAPEMLEALRVAVVALAHVSERAGSYKHAYETVSAAIAKARGEA